MKKFLIIALLAIFGAGNALYLTMQEMKISQGEATQPSFCDINDKVSCTTVLQSPYTKIFGISFPMIALFVYPVLFLIAIISYFKKRHKGFLVLGILSAMGICFNSYIIYQELFVIGAVCILCAICTGIIISICAISWVGYRQK